jgi:predicted alpha/beta superfamily hydrolase
VTVDEPSDSVSAIYRVVFLQDGGEVFGRATERTGEDEADEDRRPRSVVIAVLAHDGCRCRPDGGLRA